MADSVTFPEEFGGSGQTITNDSDPDTGLGNGGHRERFVPALKGVVDMAAYAKGRAEAAAGYVDTVMQYRDQAQQAADRSDRAALKAEAKSEQVDYSLDQAMEVYGSIQDVKNAADSAEASNAKAEQWADYPPDSDIPGTDGQKSARHWAQKAMERTAGALIAQGAWDASTKNYPEPPEFSAYWLVTGAAQGVTVNGENYRNKDMLLYTLNSAGEPGVWTKIDNTDAVASVAGKTGAVLLVPGDIEGLGSAATKNAGTAAGNVMPVGAFNGPTGSEKFIHTGRMQFPRYEVARNLISFNSARNAIDPQSGMMFRCTGSSSNKTTIAIPDFSSPSNTMTLVIVFSSGYADNVSGVTWEGNIVWGEGKKPSNAKTSSINNSVVVTMLWLDFPGYWLATTTYIEGAPNQ